MSNTQQNRKLLGSGLLLALASSLCCIVPLFALFGAAGSMVSIFSWIAPLRPYLLVLTAIVLGIAFYLAYRPAKKDECGCTDKKTGMQSKRFLWVIALLSIGLSTFPYYADYFYQKTPVQPAVKTGQISQTVIKIKGMSCAACEGHVNHTLQQQKGVQQVSTSYAKGESLVKFDSSQISLQQLAAAIEKETGYTVINIKNDVN
ncbi:mercuric transport protein MerTP [Sphingobacterium multivorum]|uniref:mercuric transport protein MerTP n=1 Tax=Sphingobacterium multivorum TaxID=28454 RepID=UPI0028981D88|nr:mercuric transport protein MerTP [Sphingobacterium multivorum]